MNTHRALQLADLLDKVQSSRIRYYNAARKAATLGNKGALGLFMAKAHKCTSIAARISARFGQAAP